MNKIIEETFVHYKTRDAFERDLAEYGAEAFEKKIVFIKNEHVIWTHGAYYNGSQIEASEWNTRFAEITNRVNELISAQNRDVITVYVEGETLCFSYGEPAE